VKAGGHGEELPSDEDEEGKDDADANAFANSDTYVPKVDEGTEVEMDGSTRNIVPAPPPPYPGDRAAFFPPPAAPPITPLPFPALEDQEEEPAPSSIMASIFGGRSLANKYQKASTLADAKEKLTAFAIKALDERDGDLAAERLKQAL
jgi:hypothetical protein